MKGVIYTTTDGATSGYFETRVDQNAADIITVSGLTGGGGGGGSYTAGSGLTLVGTEFNVYGGSGNFENIHLTTDNNVTPKMVFTGSGVTDTPIRMKVLSSHASASTSGTALAFEGTEGQLFGITYNLSSGRIFTVNDITGLPLISVDGGDVELAEFGRDIIAHKAITLQSGVPSVTTNKLYNDGYGLYFNGSAVGGGGGGTTYTAGSGLTLVGTEFNTAGTVTLRRLLLTIEYRLDKILILLFLECLLEITPDLALLNFVNFMIFPSLGLGTSTVVKDNNIFVGDYAAVNSTMGNCVAIGLRAASGLVKIGDQTDETYPVLDFWFAQFNRDRYRSAG